MMKSWNSRHSVSGTTSTITPPLSKLYQPHRTRRKQKRFRWLDPGVFKPSLAAHLREDSAALAGILGETVAVTPACDYKLQALIRLVSRDHPQQKFILFTQFADTAYYLDSALKAAGIADTDCATGDSENPAAQAWRFSPESNDKLRQFPPGQQTRVLARHRCALGRPEPPGLVLRHQLRSPVGDHPPRPARGPRGPHRPEIRRDLLLLIPPRRGRRKHHPSPRATSRSG